MVLPARGCQLLSVGHIVGAVEERDDEDAAPRAVVEPHDDDPQEYSEHRHEANRE